MKGSAGGGKGHLKRSKEVERELFKGDFKGWKGTLERVCREWKDILERVCKGWKDKLERVCRMLRGVRSSNNRIKDGFRRPGKKTAGGVESGR